MYSLVEVMLWILKSLHRGVFDDIQMKRCAQTCPFLLPPPPPRTKPHPSPSSHPHLPPRWLLTQTNSWNQYEEPSCTNTELIDKWRNERFVAIQKWSATVDSLISPRLSPFLLFSSLPLSLLALTSDVTSRTRTWDQAVLQETAQCWSPW